MNKHETRIFINTLGRLYESFPAPTNYQHYQKTKVDIWLKDFKDFIDAYQSFDTSAREQE